MSDDPASKLGHLEKESCCSLPVARALPPCLQSRLWPGMEYRRTVTMLELSPEDELTAASQHGMAGKTGMG